MIYHRRVSPDEWRLNIQQLHSGAETAHNAAAMMKSEARGCIDETEREQNRRQSDTNKDIEQRLNDLELWTNNEREELKLNISQSHELLELRERLQLMLKVVQVLTILHLCKLTNSMFVPSI